MKSSSSACSSGIKSQVGLPLWTKYQEISCNQESESFDHLPPVLFPLCEVEWCAGKLNESQEIALTEEIVRMKFESHASASPATECTL